MFGGEAVAPHTRPSTPLAESFSSGLHLLDGLKVIDSHGVAFCNGLHFALCAREVETLFDAS